MLDGARALREPGPKHMTMRDVEQFDAGHYYHTLLTQFPFLTTCLAAAATRPSSMDTQSILEVCITV